VETLGANNVQSQFLDVVVVSLGTGDWSFSTNCLTANASAGSLMCYDLPLQCFELKAMWALCNKTN